MSIYDRRTTPAYTNTTSEPSYASNRHILKWWTPAHDELLVKQIKKDQWLWYWGIADIIVEHTDKETLETWKRTDPVCQKYAWYNVLMYFAVARADQLHFTDAIREPEWKVCPLCGERFIESSLPMPLAERLGIGSIDFCSPCLTKAVFQEGNTTLSREEIMAYLAELSQLLGRIPNQGFGGGKEDLQAVARFDRAALLRLLQRKPTVQRVKEEFGSWLGALIAAGVLEDNARPTARGTQCLARDGHLCLSLGEKTIDDYLTAQAVAHEKEPAYPESNYRADFRVGDTFIEYFGLTGNPDYDSRSAEKKRICRKHGIRLIAIYPSDLVSLKRLQNKLGTIFDATKGE